mmetsp:Transcript_15376/g.11182  ORF Transcript_15376/g.11182 Transcript_15376/m.11182 type:complete len:121 (+) Transcript_15376:636-998(+)
MQTGISHLIKVNKALSQKVISKRYSTEESFENFLNQEITDSYVIELLQKRGLNYSRLYESKIYRLTQPLAKLIERYFILSNLNLVCYKDQYKAESLGASPLFTIPIFRIQSVEFLHKNEP